ncbi:PREDICTED: uncharacterized protein LOC105135679 [Populus euphratica]|uniref:Uncharacterized protein LOC105135679 n=1 Tax=Populus euphratica TaxID=75702 RepID=A0AAJ6Y1T5_POPEU|nr:PREDICTED: uncharacterized protein LOC105135679 [Populus euphratica]
MYKSKRVREAAYSISVLLLLGKWLCCCLNQTIALLHRPANCNRWERFAHHIFHLAKITPEIILIIFIHRTFHMAERTIMETMPKFIHHILQPETTLQIMLTFILKHCFINIFLEIQTMHSNLISMEKYPFMVEQLLMMNKRVMCASTELARHSANQMKPCTVLN